MTRYCFGFVAVALLISGRAAAIEGDEILPCTSHCNGNASRCYDGCRKPNGLITTCIKWNSDYDGDGVLNTSDNCECHWNANQADCDGDNVGDACDLANVLWVLTENDPSICAIDKDYHLFNYAIEFHSRTVWQNVCGSATCIKEVTRASKTCSYGTDDVDCCEELAFTSGYGAMLSCNNVGIDICGTPKCNF